MSDIGVGARIFLGVQRIFAQKVFVRLLPTIFVVWPRKKWSSLVFLQILGAIFRSQTALGVIFAQIFRDFAQIFRDFAWIFNK